MGRLKRVLGWGLMAMVGWACGPYTAPAPLVTGQHALSKADQQLHLSMLQQSHKIHQYQSIQSTWSLLRTPAAEGRATQVLLFHQVNDTSLTIYGYHQREEQWLLMEVVEDFRTQQPIQKAMVEDYNGDGLVDLRVVDQYPQWGYLFLMEETGYRYEPIGVSLEE